MRASRTVRTKLIVGSGVLVAALALLLALLACPGFARPAGRVLSALRSALDDEREDDLVLRIDGLAGVRPGLPAWVTDAAGDARPVAHVLASGRDDEGAWVRLRFEPGEPGAQRAGRWRARVYPPSRKLGAALEVAVTPAAARRFGADIADRLEALWEEAILPEAEARLPAFLARIDPSGDTEARGVAKDVAASAGEHLDPLLDDLAADVTKAVKEKFDLLDRLGLLWKLVRGDAEGLNEQILPVARSAAKAWWTENEAEVVKALGSAVRANLGALKDWAGGELFEAAREELVAPILAAQRERLEDDGEAILRLAVGEFVRAPGGGFRVRFASLLRTQLLHKKTALLLLERVEAPR